MTLDIIDINALHEANVLPRTILRAKVIVSGTLERPLRIRGLGVTKGARAAIEAAGGVVEDSNTSE
jgi:large subunit ribosomal protein L15